MPNITGRATAVSFTYGAGQGSKSLYFTPTNSLASRGINDGAQNYSLNIDASLSSNFYKNDFSDVASKSIAISRYFKIF